MQKKIASLQYPLTNGRFPAIVGNPVSKTPKDVDCYLKSLIVRGPVPDTFALPVVLKNPQEQRIGNA